MKSVTDHSFEVCFQEWSGDTTHAGEGVDYLVLEAGDHVLSDGSTVEAGTASVGTTFVHVSFRETFATSPMVLAQTQTYVEAKAVVARIKGISSTGFDAILRTDPIGSHASETVGYVTIAPHANPTVLATWTRGIATAPSGATIGSIVFPGNFSGSHRVLAWFATENATADASLRLTSRANGSAAYFRETRASAMQETLHYFAFASSMNLTARMTTKPATGMVDTDGDTLSDGVEVNTYGSNPTLKDTDSDGLADNVEVADRTVTIPVNGTARTFTFRTSPTSDDTDADGVKDPDELNGILEHRSLFLDMATLRAGALRDLSGNGGDGTISGATCTSSVSGRLGSACSFAGASGRIQVADSPLLDLTSAFTITAWIYPTTTAQPSGAGIVAKGTGGGGEAYAVDISSGKFRTFFWKAGASYVAQGTTSIAANTWYLVVAVYDGPSGRLRLYVNAASPTEISGVPSSLASNDHVLSIGSRESSATSGYNLGFIGRIDEVQIWARPLAFSEISAYRNITNGGSPVAWLDMETRDASNNLFDFSGTGHPGAAVGTTIVGGRTGFARSFAGGNDGISLANSGGLSFGASTGTGVTADAYVLLTSQPATDVSIVARKGQFYLNVTSDGRVQWSLYRSGSGGRTVSVASSMPLPLNRWVQITGTAVKQSSTATLLSLYADGALGPQAYGRTFPSASSLVTIGYTEGQPHFVGAIDEVLIMAMEAAITTIQGRSARGILLNPNATDTDGDGLADGQELFVKSVKTPKRYPTKDVQTLGTDLLELSLSNPSWAIARADAMVGFTHEDMGEIDAWLRRGSYAVMDRTRTLRSFMNVGEANNFTSYDLLQKPEQSTDSWLAPEDLVATGYTWFVQAKDWAFSATKKEGQIEYLQIQVTVHTLPNRADTDADGLNDSEELDLGSDGFQTDPWKTDTDGDAIGDSIEYTGWSRSGGAIVANPSGFHTDPTRADTDLDGYADGVDRWPLQDAYAEIYVDFFQLVTQSVQSTTLFAYPYAIVQDVGGNQTISEAHAQAPCSSLQSGGWVYCSGRIDHQYTIDLSDTAASVTFTVEFRQDRSRYNTGGDIGASITPSGSNRVTAVWTVNDDLSVVNGFRAYESQVLVTINGVSFRNRLEVTVTLRTGTRSNLNLVVPNDYSGVYNVTGGCGAAPCRRYVGEPRFVQVVINGSAPTTYLVPRSLFFDTKFYKDLQTQAVLQAAPYTKMKGYQNGTGTANSDVVQVAYVFDGLTAAEALVVRDALLKNATGAVNKTVLTWTSADWSTIRSPYLTGLAAEILQAIPFVASWYSSPSHPENIDSNAPPVPWWVQLAQGIASAIATTLQFIHSGLVWLGNLVVQFVEALKNFGSWLSDLTSGDPVRVANAVQAAQKAFDQMLSGIGDAILAVIHAILDPLINLVVSAYTAWADEAAALVLSYPRLSAGDFVRGLVQLTFFSAFALAIFAIIVAFSVAEKITNAMTLGLANLAGFVIGAVAGLIIGMLVVAAVNEWLGSTVIEDLLPPGFDDITGATFTVAQFLFAYELAQRPLKPIQGVETALKDSILGLMILGVSFAIKTMFGESLQGLISLVIVDAVALYLALSGLKDMITISGRGANLVRLWYPFLYPVTVAMNAISIATTATDLVADAGKLNDALAGG